MGEGGSAVVRLAPPEPPLGDDVLRLVPLEERHAAPMRDLGDDADVARFTWVRAPLTDESARAWVERYVAGWQDGTLGGFAIEGREDGAFLGFAALVRFDPEGREAELGYIVAPAARGRGVAVRAIGLLTGWCLDGLGLARVELRIDVVNGPSLGVAERLGFVREGVLRSMHFKDGRRTDLAVYSRLPGDP
jgi:RimJ/RimL family protein N-acetyltransferase